MRYALAFLLIPACLMLLVPLQLAAQTPDPTGPSVRVDQLAAEVSGIDIAWRCFENITVVVWGSEGSVGDDSDGFSIQARFFRGREPRGPQQQVNTFTAGDQMHPEV